MFALIVERFIRSLTYLNRRLAIERKREPDKQYSNIWNKKRAKKNYPVVRKGTLLESSRAVLLPRDALCTARYCHRMSSVRLSVCLSVRL